MDGTINNRWTWRPGGDVVLWVIAVMLAAVSVLVVYSSIGAKALDPDGGGDHIGVLTRQLVIVLMGLAAIWAVHKINYQFYGRVVWAVYTLALVFTVLVYFIGEANPEAPDAPRWILIPIVNFTFQPSDFLKVATVMVVARELARHQKTIDRTPVFPPLGPRRFREQGGARTLKETTIPLLGPIVVSCVAVLPTNLSTTLILFGTCFVMLFIGRVRISELSKFALSMLLAGALFAAADTAYGHFTGRGDDSDEGGILARSSTWRNRIEAFLGDESKQVDQVRQAEIAIAAGGLTGRGVGESIQRGNLPYAESDYAYAFIVEEYGALVGGLGVLLLYLWIFFRAILIFRKCGTAFPSLLVLGLALLITLQAIANMLVSTNMIPATGVTLPLISKGGSSELFLSLALGMMLGVSRQVSEQTLDKPREESLLESPNTRKSQ